MTARTGVGIARDRRLVPALPALLRDTAFRRYWSGQTISMFGDQISALVIPLVAVLSLRADAAQMGILAALVWVPSLLFGVHAGAWVDRRGHRRVTMIAADLGRAVLLGTIPASYAAGVLTIWQLYAVAFGTGALSVLFSVSDPALFVAMVGDQDYVAGNSLLYGSRAFSFVGGPSIAGVLVQALTAPVAVLADALSFLGSAFFLLRIRPEEPPTAEPGDDSLTGGARFIRHDRVVRAALLAVATINFFNFIFLALFVLYANRSLHIAPGTLGLVVGVGAVGGVLGALLTKILAARFGVGRAFLAGCLLFTAPIGLVPLAGGSRPILLSMLMAATFLSFFGVMVLDIAIGSIFAAVIPNELRSRVNGAFQAVNYGVRPLGALAGGFLGTVLGMRPTLWIAAVGGTAGCLWLLPSPVPRFCMPADSDQDSRRPAPAGCEPAALRN
jgi:MFS family permease